MTVPTDLAFNNAAWTGVETSFNPAFRAQAASHVKVYSRDAAGALTLLTLGVHYSVALDASGNVTVTPIALPAAPKTLLFYRRTPATQGVQFQDNQSFPAATHTLLHDARALADAELLYDLTRAILLPIGETGFTLDAAAARAGKLMIFDAAGALILTSSTAAVWFTGSGAPSAGLGKDTDFYLRTSNGDVYQKTAGAWSVVANIMGPTGPAGSISTVPDGTIGAPGLAFAADTNSGVRRAGADDVRLVAGATDALGYTATLVSVLVALSVTGGTSINGALVMGGDLSPAQITANQTDYAPAGTNTASVFRINSDAARSIFSLDNPGDKRLRAYCNTGSFAITFKDDDGATGTAAQRFAIGFDYVLLPKRMTLVWYDTTSARWRLFLSFEIATAANFLANSASKILSVDQVWAAAAPVAVADSATITLDFNTGIHFEIAAMAGNRTLAAPSNRKKGQDGTILFVQDATGSRVPVPNAVFKNFPTLSTAASKKDWVAYHVADSQDVICGMYSDNI